MKTILPIIKWTGTKRFLAEKIVSYFPNGINTYYEPFIGSGSVVAKFLESGRTYNKIICSDINPDLLRKLKGSKNIVHESLFLNYE